MFAFKFGSMVWLVVRLKTADWLLTEDSGSILTTQDTTFSEALFYRVGLVVADLG